MKRAALLLVLLLLAIGVDARIGGGDSYSGSSDSSSSDSDSGSFDFDSSDSDDDDSSRGSSPGSGSNVEIGSGGCAVVSLLLIFVLLVVAIQAARGGSKPRSLTITHGTPQPADLSRIRAHDPNFSEIVFTDFCYSLFARVHEARGRGRLDDFAPYLAPGLRAGLKHHAPRG